VHLTVTYAHNLAWRSCSRLNTLAGAQGEDCVFVANDWHSALVPIMIKDVYQPRGEYLKAKVAFCIHNIAFQVSQLRSHSQCTCQHASPGPPQTGHALGLMSPPSPAVNHPAVPHCRTSSDPPCLALMLRGVWRQAPPDQQHRACDNASTVHPSRAAQGQVTAIATGTHGIHQSDITCGPTCGPYCANSFSRGRI
jgi:hypothetical protein